MSRAGAGPAGPSCLCHQGTAHPLPPGGVLWLSVPGPKEPLALMAPSWHSQFKLGEDIGIYRSCLQSWLFHYHDWIKGLFQSVHITTQILFLHIAVSTMGLWVKYSSVAFLVFCFHPFCLTKWSEVRFGITNINDLHTARDKHLVGQDLKIWFVFLCVIHSLVSPVELRNGAVVIPCTDTEITTPNPRMVTGSGDFQFFDVLSAFLVISLFWMLIFFIQHF